MLRDPNMQALARCGREVIAATNGHGRRWAAERCVRALVAAGTPAAIAANSTQAMVAVARGIADAAAASQAAP
ncbi:hypothetical protein [Acidovorax sp.]|uniref:hypothetical protein n=1 Tax=Acidovorax sp. TaxID=1872122 RepID=UPI00258F9C88|nr:hypothetical protein [Acidovorax sp.]